MRLAFVSFLIFSYWFFFLRVWLLFVPVHEFRGLILTGALGLLFWHHVKLCIVHGRFPADNPLRKNHGQILYPPIRMLSEPFRLFACGFRAGAEEDSL